MGVSLLAGLLTLAIAQSTLANTRIATGNARYEIRVSQLSQFAKCIFQNDAMLFCLEADLVTFGKTIKTKNYTIVPIYDQCGGSGCLASSTTLLIEKGNDTVVSHSIRNYCLECSDKIEVNYDADEVYFMLDRVDGAHKVAARFKDGAILVGKAKLNPSESLKAAECDWLYKDYLDGCIDQRGQKCRSLRDELAMAYLRGIGMIERQYAGFASAEFDRYCENACASGAKPSRAQFNKQICRR